MSETITLTFGDAGENHTGMKIIGKIGDIGSGFTKDDLVKAKINKRVYNKKYW